MDRRAKRKLKLALKLKRRRTRFTPAEQSFFEAGERLADDAEIRADSFADLGDGGEPNSFWSRLARRSVPA